jgi:starch phosphorylase
MIGMYDSQQIDYLHTNQKDKMTQDVQEQDKNRLTAATIAYFSMEIALSDALPTYSGGLGVLAGDFLRSAADLGLPFIGMTLLYRDGYFLQHVDESGKQTERPVQWSPESLLERINQTIEIEIGSRVISVGVWRYVITGETGHKVPVYFLDTSVIGNHPDDQEITDQLYGGDQRHRLRQEAVLGLAGSTMLPFLGHDNIAVYHMNEGHSSFLTLNLLEKEIAKRPSHNHETQQDPDDYRPARAEIASVRSKCVFTTHTPVPAGHDKFPRYLIREELGENTEKRLEQLGLLPGDELNMTVLGMSLSHYINAVSLEHKNVTKSMFPDTAVTSVTNGVHATQWTAVSTAKLFDRYIQGWRQENSLLRYAAAIPLEELELSHEQAKRALLQVVLELTGKTLDPEALTIGLARRATPYKQTDLIFKDTKRLAEISEKAGKIQIVCSSKAHPADAPGKALIERIFAASKELSPHVEVVFLPNYNLSLGVLLSAGTDLWLNNPTKPYEASGTSGMKAALNGVPSLSTLDGWWIEGCIENMTGWAIGGREYSTTEEDAEALYDKLESVVAPLYTYEKNKYLEIMRSTIAVNGSWFTAARMVREYSINAYKLVERRRAPIDHGHNHLIERRLQR